MNFLSQVEILEPPVKRANDTKEYRVIRLQNGLTACLVSESFGRMAAAALCVGVGSFSDPQNIPGIAHILEHITGVDIEEEDSSYGSLNAATHYEVTNFHFECTNQDFRLELSKFASFFSQPVIKKSSLMREREAIESEFQLEFNSDEQRIKAMVASLADADSPVSNFNCGNMASFSTNVTSEELYEAVVQFRKRHYSAHRMTLAVQAPVSLDELQSLVFEYFSDITSNNLPTDDFRKFANSFDTPEFTKLYYVESIDHVPKLQLAWALPSLQSKYRSKPDDYVYWVLSNEGPGSLLSFLKKKCWVFSLSVVNATHSFYAFFRVTMCLSTEGLDHLYEVIGHFFSYLNMVVKTGPQEYLYYESKTIAKTSFDHEYEDTAEFVKNLTENMMFYPSKEYITGSKLLFEYDPTAVQEILALLTPERMNVMILCQSVVSGVSYDKMEKWYSIKYTAQEIPQKSIQEWKNAPLQDHFYLPPPNPFLTTDCDWLKLEEEAIYHPEKILATEMVDLWLKQTNTTYATFEFHFINPIISESAKMSVLTDLYIKLLDSSLDEEVYSAKIAGISYSIYAFGQGIVLSVAGYGVQKVQRLTETVIKSMTNFETKVNHTIFDFIREIVSNYYQNDMLQCQKLAEDTLSEILVDKHCPLRSKHKIVSTVTFSDIINFSKFLKKLFVKVFIHGKASKSDAIDIVKNVTMMLNCEHLPPYKKIRVRKIPKGESFCMVKAPNNGLNSVVANYYQLGSYTPKDRVIMEIVKFTIGGSLFTTLRTKEQLAYEVSLSCFEKFGVLGFLLEVNGKNAKHSCSYTESRLDDFMRNVRELLEQTTSENFEIIKRNFMETEYFYLERHWLDILGDYPIGRQETEVEECEKLSLDDVKKWWKRRMSYDRKSNFRKLSIQVFSTL